MLRVADHFERHETKLRGGNAAKLERLRETEGTVLLHVDVALKQDASLATAVLKAMGKDMFKPTPFMVSSTGPCECAQLMWRSWRFCWPCRGRIATRRRR